MSYQGEIDRMAAGKWDSLVTESHGQDHGKIAADRVTLLTRFLGAIPLGKQPLVRLVHIIV